MKRSAKFLSILLLIICFNSFPQDWSPLKPGMKYNYTFGDDSLIVATLWIDSIQLQGADSIFFLNRVVKDCDTCEKMIYTNSPKYAFYNQPMFLQEKVLVTDTSYTFITPENFVIFHRADSGFTWVFDTLNAINATVTGIKELQVFNIDDTVKFITLSTGDTILVSKNFGIVRFDAVYEDRDYSLAGIDKKYGKSVPCFTDIFIFSVGDIFEYKGYKIHDGSPNYSDFIEKAFINSKTHNGDTLKYGVHIKYTEADRYYPTHPDPYYDYSFKTSYETEWIFIDSIKHPANRYHGELIDYFEILTWYYPESKVRYTMLRSYNDEKGRFTKMIGSVEQNDYFFVSDSSHYLLERATFLYEWDINEFRYQPGLGEVYYENSGFEWGSKRELVAYRKGVDTVGNFTPDDFFSSMNEPGYSEHLTLYPNPVRETLFIQSGLPFQVNGFIRNLSGQLIYTFTLENGLNTYDTNRLKPGVYLVNILTPDGFVVKMFVKY